QSPASLSINSFVAAPATVGTGRPFTVVLEVKNIGQTLALNVSPSALVQSVPGSAAFVSGPLPASAATLASGASAFFTYRYDSLLVGPLSFTAKAQGLDQNENTLKTSPQGGSNTINIFPQGSLNSEFLTLLPAGPLSIG